MTPVNQADITQLPALLHADDDVVFGDAGYTSDTYKRGARALGMRWCINDKRKAGHGNLSRSQRKRNRRHSRVRAPMSQKSGIRSTKVLEMRYFCSNFARLGPIDSSEPVRSELP